MFESAVSSIFRQLSRLIDLLSTLGAFLGVIAVLVMLVATVVEVFSRRAGSPTLWAYDAGIYALLGLSFLTVAAVERHDEHMVVDFFVLRMRPGLRRTSEYAARAASLAFVLLLAWQGWNVASESMSLGRTTTGMLQFPTFWLESLMPVGCGLLALQQVKQLLRRAGTIRKAEGIPQVTPESL